MNAGLLARYFGTDRQWKGPCVAIVDSDATIQSTGSDAIMHGGAKVFAPRTTSGRVPADHACFLPEEQTLLLVQTHRIRQAGGEDLHQNTLLAVSLAHLVALEFSDLSPLKAWGLAEPRR